MSPSTDGQPPQHVPARDGIAAPRSQRGALVVAGGLITTSVALAVLAAVIIFVSLAQSASARHLAAKRLQLAERRYQLTESQLRAGDCLTGSDLNLENDSAWPSMFTELSCTQPHLAEVFYVGYPWLESQATYPGYDAILKVTAERCGAAFAAYDGIPLSQSKFIYHSVAPTPASDWAAGDREVVCMAFDPNQLPPLNYSIKGKYQ